MISQCSDHDHDHHPRFNLLRGFLLRSDVGLQAGLITNDKAQVDSMAADDDICKAKSRELFPTWAQTIY